MQQNLETKYRVNHLKCSDLTPCLDVRFIIFSHFVFSRNFFITLLAIGTASQKFPELVKPCFYTTSAAYPGGGGGGGRGDSHIKGAEMLVGNLELNPERRPIWAWPKLF